ncbi:hypothetical protein ACJ7VZ_05290 [Aeromonas salmonicida]|uniref:hypothetical protein n=1 Tax=Aeromonas salmonicida TaxID=645 RepID=UPI0038BBE3E2
MNAANSPALKLPSYAEILTLNAFDVPAFHGTHEATIKNVNTTINDWFLATHLFDYTSIRIIYSTLYDNRLDDASKTKSPFVSKMMFTTNAQSAHRQPQFMNYGSRMSGISSARSHGSNNAMRWGMDKAECESWYADITSTIKQIVNSHSEKSATHGKPVQPEYFTGYMILNKSRTATHATALLILKDGLPFKEYFFIGGLHFFHYPSKTNKQFVGHKDKFGTKVKSDIVNGYCFNCFNMYSYEEVEYLNRDLDDDFQYCSPEEIEPVISEESPTPSNPALDKLFDDEELSMLSELAEAEAVTNDPEETDMPKLPISQKLLDHTIEAVKEMDPSEDNAINLLHAIELSDDVLLKPLIDSLELTYKYQSPEHLKSVTPKILVGFVHCCRYSGNRSVVQAEAKRLGVVSYLKRLKEAELEMIAVDPDDELMDMLNDSV